MRATVAIGLFAVFIAGYHGQQKQPQATTIQETGKQTPPKTIPPIANSASAEQKPRRYQKTKGYLRVAFGPEYFATWILVIAAGVGIAFTWKTLRSIKRQTDALVEGQRPRIVASGHGNPTVTIYDKDAHRVEISIQNNGVLPAQRLTYENWIEILPFPFTGFTMQATYAKSDTPMTLYARGAPLVVNIPMQRKVRQEEITQIRNLKLYVCIRLRVTYQDAFGKRYAEFGYYVMPDGFGILPRYNDSN